MISCGQTVTTDLLELVLVRPGRSEAGRGFSVLISSALINDEVDTLARY